MISKNLFEKAKTAIEKNNLFFIEDVAAFCGVHRDTLYNNFPVNSDKFGILKEMLEVNKIRTKSAIRAKLYKGDKAAELLALYRLICTPEERQNLNQSYIDHNVRVKGIKFGKDAEDEQVYE